MIFHDLFAQGQSDSQPRRSVMCLAEQLKHIFVVGIFKADALVAEHDPGVIDVAVLARIGPVTILLYDIRLYQDIGLTFFPFLELQGIHQELVKQQGQLFRVSFYPGHRTCLQGEIFPMGVVKNFAAGLFYDH